MRMSRLAPPNGVPDHSGCVVDVRVDDARSLSFYLEWSEDRTLVRNDQEDRKSHTCRFGVDLAPYFGTSVGTGLTMSSLGV